MHILCYMRSSETIVLMPLSSTVIRQSIGNPASQSAPRGAGWATAATGYGPIGKTGRGRASRVGAHAAGPGARNARRADRSRTALRPRAPRDDLCSMMTAGAQRATPQRQSLPQREMLQRPHRSVSLQKNARER